MRNTPTYDPDCAIDKENGFCIYLDQSEHHGLLDEQTDFSAILRAGQNIGNPAEQAYVDMVKNIMLKPLSETKNGRTAWCRSTDGIAVLTNTFGHIVYALNMEPHYIKKIANLRNRYIKAKARLHGSDELTVVLRAVHACRVDLIFVEAGKTISGHYHADTGEINFGSNGNMGSGDIIEDVLIAVMKDKRDIIVLPARRMPTDTGIAAFFLD